MVCQHYVSRVLIDISSGNGSLPDVTNTLPDSAVIHGKLDTLQLNFNAIF